MSDSNRDLPPLDWIRVFETAARHVSFSAAADELGLTQAAISQRIRNLEQRIGAQLFNRHPRGVTLSTQGEAWLPHVQIALSQLGRSTANLFAAPRKKVTIAASASVIGLWIAPRLMRIADELPQLQIVCETIHNLPDFDRSSADLEIRFGDGNWPGRAAKRLFHEELTPLAAPQLLKNGVTDWQKLPLIATSGPRLGWRDWFDACQSPPGHAPRMRFDTFILALTAAQAGVGVILGSLPLCEGEIQTGRLKRLSQKTLKMEAGYWISWDERSAFRERSALLDLLLSPANT